MQRLVLLGATGSLGQQTLDIVRRYPGHFSVQGMSAHRNEKGLFSLAERFQTESLFLAESGRDDPRLAGRIEDLVDEETDHLIVADHGLGSLAVVLKALAMKKKVSIANKELLVAHGQDIVYLAHEQGTEIIPLDSEHNGLFQALQGEKISDVRRLIITASGGPFRDRKWEDLGSVTIEQVLNHPTWKMGKKTTIDSATLVNKAFEVIETHHLFGIPYASIEVRLHPQSIIHSIVEFHDGNTKIIASKPDMRFPIGYALFYPQRAPHSLTGDQKGYFDFATDLALSRIEPGRFPCFDAVMKVAQQAPQNVVKVLENDQRAIDHFLKGEISFHDILQVLQKNIEL